MDSIYVLEFQNPDKKLAFMSREIAQEAAKQEELTGIPPLRLIQIPLADAKYAKPKQFIKVKS